MIRPEIVIIGGGFSGTALAINLARHHGPRTLLIHKRAQAGFGLAYSTRSDAHLLNVRAGNMGALADEPGHFLQWLQRRNPQATSHDFVPRHLFGTYLAELLSETIADAPDQLTCRHAEVVHLGKGEGGFRLGLSDGSTLTAGQVVLARATRRRRCRTGWTRLPMILNAMSPIRGRPILLQA